MLLPLEPHEYLLSLDLRHWKMTEFQTSYFNQKWMIYISAKQIEVRKWNDDNTEFGTVAVITVKVKSMTVEHWKYLMAFVSIAPKLQEDFFETLANILKPAI